MKNVLEPNHNALVELLKSGKILSIGGHVNAGVIIQKPLYADFVSHGSAIGGAFDLDCTAVYVLGTVQLSAPENCDDIGDAVHRRASDMELMRVLRRADSPLVRSIAMLRLLCSRFRGRQVQTVPQEVLAQLVGVVPDTLTEAWQRILMSSHPNSAVADSECSELGNDVGGKLVTAIVLASPAHRGSLEFKKDDEGSVAAQDILKFSAAPLPKKSSYALRSAVRNLRLQYYFPFVLASSLLAWNFAPNMVHANQGSNRSSSDELPVLQDSDPSTWPAPELTTPWPDNMNQVINIPVGGPLETTGNEEDSSITAIPELPDDLKNSLPSLSPSLQPPSQGVNSGPSGLSTPAVPPDLSDEVGEGAVDENSVDDKVADDEAADDGAADEGAESTADNATTSDRIPTIISPYEPDEYRLTIGDTISVFAANIPEFTTENIIRSDGSINLPVVGEILVWDMTLPEAEIAIRTLYVESEVLENPDITVRLLASSPLKYAIAGEINRPGAYDVPVLDKRLPTISDAIRQAGGISSEADLRNIEVYRHNRKGGQELIKLNLFALYQEADLSQNITLRSGDRIVIPNAPVYSDEAQLIASANISPDAMQVGILGEVLSPGLIQAPTNTALNQALILVGGFNSRAKKTVQLIRTEEDGTVSREKIKIDWTANVGDETNPILKNRDVVLVGPNTIAKYSDFLDRALGPINRTIPFIGILDLIFPSNNNNRR
ncbi:MAG: SLBB domain-containing protein [Cyanobacteria bacterium P01_F01_bin.42]